MPLQTMMVTKQFRFPLYRNISQNIFFKGHTEKESHSVLEWHE